MNVYNSFKVYISTNDSARGKLVGSRVDDKWWLTYDFTSTLIPGQDYYLHIKATNAGGVSGFLGGFTIEGTDHLFSNNYDDVTTNPTIWRVSATGWNNYQSATNYGANGVAPWGSIPNVSNRAKWIWSSDNNDNVVYFSTKIKAVEPAINHYQIIHNTNGLTCDAETVTIKACTNAYDGTCSLSNTSVTLDVKATGTNTVTDSISFTGTGIASIPYTVAESTVLSIDTPSIPATNTTVCFDGSTTSCNLVFSDAGFRFLYGAGNDTRLPSQTSGTEFGDVLKLQAVKNNNGVCTGLFNGNKDVDLSQENVNPGGVGGLKFTIDGNDIAKHSSVSNTRLNFGADSIATLSSPIYHDAGQIRLHANYDVDGITLSGNSNQFWVSPAELIVSAKSGSNVINGAAATASTIHKAGENFELTVSAYNSRGVITPNYSPGQIQLKLERNGPTLSVSVDGYLTYASASTLATSTTPVFQDARLSSFSLGVSSYSAAQYSEVGLLNLDVQDNNYGNAGIVIPAEAINIGRFTPDHFKQAVVENGYFYTTCNAGTAFAYSGQKDEATDSIGTISYLVNPVLAITAYNKHGAITQNYFQDSQGSVNDFMKLSAADVVITAPTLDQVARGVDGNKLTLTGNMVTGNLSQIDLTVLPNVLALDKGVLHYELSDDDNFFYNRSANALVAPFTSDIDLSVSTIKDSDGVNVSTMVDLSPVGVEILFGRLVLENSFGPETSNLPQPMQIEHFDGANFVVTSNNDCVSYDASEISLTNISLDPAFTSVLGGTGHFVDGKIRTIELDKPGAGHRGKIGVSYDIYDWLKFDWDNDGLHYDNPYAIATFGLYRGNDRIIYWREVFN